MFDRFTDNARTAMALARKEAQDLNHNAIGSEHILLAVAQLRPGVAAAVLDNLGATEGRIRDAVLRVVRPGPAGFRSSQIPVSEHGKDALGLACEEAARLGHRYVGTEHLLLGILLVKGTASKVLTDLGLALEATRSEILEVIGEPPQAPGRARRLPPTVEERLQAVEERLAKVEVRLDEGLRHLQRLIEEPTGN